MIGNAILNLRPGQGFNIDGDVKNETDYKEKTSWVTGKDKNNAAILGEFDSIENPPTWAEIQAEIARIQPGVEWKQKMIESDSFMSRDRENSITRLDNGVADNEEEQKRYDSKIALRTKNPFTA